MHPTTLAGYRRSWLLSGLLAAASMAGGCSGAHEPAQHAAAGHAMAQVQATANVPALLGTSIEGLRRRLGPSQPLPALLNDPIRQAELAPRATDSLLTFSTGGLLLTVSYDIRSRRVNDLFLYGQHEDSLMQRAALRPDAASYVVLPAFQSRRPGHLLGVRVIPISR